MGTIGVRQQEVKRMAVSDAKMLAVRKERDTAVVNSRRAREDARVAKAEKKEIRKEARAKYKAMAREYGKLALIFGAAIAAGSVVGGQLTRVNKPWMGKAQASMLLVGLALIILAKGRMWMQVAGITIISMGGVKLSDLSRANNWIPGDADWEKPIPPAGTEGYTIEVVPNNG
jgi:hypothetical protein